MARRLEVIGHRGARGLFPENTLEGFRAARTLGVAAFELDVGMTADGAVVVCHDPALNPDLARDPAGDWIAPPGPLLRSLTVGALARYDVGRIRPGSRTARLFPDQAPIDGARVPTLASVLAALPEARLIIEVKTNPARPEQTAEPAVLAEAVLALVEAARAAGRVVIESFDWRVQSHIRRIRPEITLAWLTHAETEQTASLWWDGIVPPELGCSVPHCVAAAAGTMRPGDAWAPEHRGLTEAQVRQAHALGLLVLPWTVNQPEDMRRLIGWQVDGLISDRPDLLVRAVG
jgi:glycerophosphoryl diester phosphodiesterase